MSGALLPENATDLQRSVADKWNRLFEATDPVPIEFLWDAWRCPSQFLPFLAYALSVDFWDDGWDENTKRQVISDSPDYHRLKGTRRAVEIACATLGRPTELVEWHEVDPPRRRGTFEVRIPIGNEESITALAGTIERARRRVSAAKPKSRSFSVTLTTEIWTAFAPSASLNSVERVELYAPPDEIQVEVAPSVGVMSAETVILGGF